MTLLDHLPSKYSLFFYILCDVNSNSSFTENQFFHTIYSDYAFLFPQPLPVSPYFQKKNNKIKQKSLTKSTRNTCRYRDTHIGTHRSSFKNKTTPPKTNKTELKSSDRTLWDKDSPEVPMSSSAAGSVASLKSNVSIQWDFVEENLLLFWVAIIWRWLLN